MKFELILEDDGIDIALKTISEKADISDQTAYELIFELASQALAVSQNPALIRALELVQQWANGVNTDPTDTISRANQLAHDVLHVASDRGDQATMYAADAIDQAATCCPQLAAYRVAERAALAVAFSEHEQHAWDKARQAQKELLLRWAKAHHL